jgi:hypothetical protein
VTTGTILLRLRFGLLVGTFVAMVAAFAAAEGAHLTIDQLTVRGLPAVLYTLNAEEAVASANEAAATSFGSVDTVRLVGAGRRYQAQMALADQSLEQVAEVNEAGVGGSETIRSVSGQLATYRELVEQAHAHYARGSPALGAAEMWHASQLMHSSGVVRDLSALESGQTSAVGARGASFWVSARAIALWVVPSLLLLAALVVAQIFLARRFHRRYSWPLLAASVLLLVQVGAVQALVLAQHRLTDARRAMDRVVLQRDTYTGALGDRGQYAVSRLLDGPCGSGCGPTVEAFRAGWGVEPRLPASDIPVARVDTERAKAGLSASVGVTASLPYAIPGFAAVICVLVLVGLRPRIDEHRYRP